MHDCSLLWHTAAMLNTLFIQIQDNLVFKMTPQQLDSVHRNFIHLLLFSMHKIQLLVLNLSPPTGAIGIAMAGGKAGNGEGSGSLESDKYGIL